MRLLIILLFIIPSICKSQNWPDWRGINRDGTYMGNGLVEKFNSEELAPKWSVSIGSGYSGPTVSNGKIYVTDLIKKTITNRRCFVFR